MQTQQALPRTSRPAPDRLLPHGSARLPCRRRCAAFVACSVSGDQQCNAGQQQRTGQRHQQQRQQRLEQQNGMHALATAAIAGALWLSAPQYASARDAIDASSPLVRTQYKLSYIWCCTANRCMHLYHCDNAGDFVSMQALVYQHASACCHTTSMPCTHKDCLDVTQTQRMLHTSSI